MAQCLTTGTGQRYDPETETETILPVFAFAENSRAEIRLESGDGSIAGALSTGGGKPGQGAPTVAYGLQANTIGRQPHNGGNGLGFSKEIAPTLTKTDEHAVASFKAGQGSKAGGIGYEEEITPTLTAADSGSNRTPAIIQPIGFESNMSQQSASTGNVFQTLTRRTHASVCEPTSIQVRRLTPRECERLQGFPDDYTRIPNWTGWRKMDADETPEQCREAGLEVKQNTKTGAWRVKDVDGPRYKALGNSWAVHCARWIGERIESVDQIVIAQQRKAA